MLKVLGVQCADWSMPRYFDANGQEINNGEFCVCQVDDHEELGYVANIEFRCDLAAEKNIYPKVLRKAEEPEVEQWRRLKEREVNALNICREKANKHNLNIKISNVRFDDKNNKVIFHFTSDKRVDFRELVRDLAAALRSRIELWQIGVRDEAREIDGFGICGCRLCCSAYIKEFQPVTIRMAKNQDIFLSPSKLSGCCGRLMCCLAYEESDYIEMAKNAASVGAYVKGEGFEGLVVERNLIAGTYVVRDDKENRQTIKHEQIREIRAPEGPMEPMPYAGAPDEDDPGDAAAENGSDA